MTHHFGIDYGSKLAGTTVICLYNETGFQLLQTAKNQDADLFILGHSPQANGLIFIDAPLSLPGVYRELDGYTDYFYRKADKELQAMSPMFLGGLTARAIQLQANAQAQSHFIEVYPGALARLLSLKKSGYKMGLDAITNCRDIVIHHLSLPAEIALSAQNIRFTNWHQFDAFLAWCIGWKVQQKTTSSAGCEAEGLIYY